MQYVKPVTTTQCLCFRKPNLELATESLKFSGYGVNFEVPVTDTESGNMYNLIEFQLTAAQAEHFESSATFKVRYGDSFDYVCGEVSPSEVIQYDSEE